MVFSVSSLCTMCSTGPWTVICRETSVSTTTVRDILPHLASCWIQGTVHSYMELSGIQQCCWYIFAVYIQRKSKLETHLKCVPNLERVLENKNALTILIILFKQFPFRSFTNHSKIFKNAFWGFVIFGMIIPFVLGKERSFHQERAQA